MIHFLEDTENKTIYYNFRTTNKSFVKMHLILKKMGVENNKFFLSLYNKDLVGVDIHDPKISNETAAAVAVEMTLNPWFTLREVIRTPSLGGLDPGHFLLHRGNLAVVFLFYLSIDIFHVLPRQYGKTFVLIILSVMNTVLSNKGYSWGIFTLHDKLRLDTSTDINNIIELLPHWLNPTITSDLKNTETKTFKALNNKISIGLSNANKERATAAGRGSKTVTIHGDEVAFLQNLSALLSGAVGGAGAIRKAATAAGLPFATIYTTTPGDPDGAGATAFKIYNECALWTENLYDAKNKEDLLNILRKNGQMNNRDIVGNKMRVNPIVLVELSHRELGDTDEEFYKKVESVEGDIIQKKRDFLLQWIRSSGLTLLDANVVKNINESMELKTPRTDITKEGYIVHYYVSKEELERIKENVLVTFGADTSEAIGKDFTRLIGLNSKTGELILSVGINESSIETIGKFFFRIMFQTFSRSVAVIERQSTGPAIIDTIIGLCVAHKKDPFKLLYNRTYSGEKLNMDEIKHIERTPVRNRDVIFYEKYRKTFGFKTTGGEGLNSRNALYKETFGNAIEMFQDRIYDKNLGKELKGLMIKNGRIDHSLKGHDDAVIAWLLALWFIWSAKNKELYDIVKLDLMIDYEFKDTENSTSEENLKKKTSKFNIECIKTILERLKREAVVINTAIKVSRTALTLLDDIDDENPVKEKLIAECNKLYESVLQASENGNVYFQYQ